MLMPSPAGSRSTETMRTGNPPTVVSELVVVDAIAGLGGHERGEDVAGVGDVSDEVSPCWGHRPCKVMCPSRSMRTLYAPRTSEGGGTMQRGVEVRDGWGAGAGVAVVFGGVHVGRFLSVRGRLLLVGGASTPAFQNFFVRRSRRPLPALLALDAYFTSVGSKRNAPRSPVLGLLG